MDNAEAQIEELQQQVEFLRHQLACSNAKILKCEKDFKALEASSKDEIASMWKQAKTMLDILREVDLVVWPAVYKAFPEFDRDMKRITEIIGDPYDRSGNMQPRPDL